MLLAGFLLLACLSATSFATCGVPDPFALRSYDCYLTVDTGDYLFVDCGTDAHENAVLFTEAGGRLLTRREGDGDYYIPSIGNHLSKGPNGGPVHLSGNDTDGLWRSIQPETEEYGATGCAYYDGPFQFNRKSDGLQVWGYELKWGPCMGHPFGKEVPYSAGSAPPASISFDAFKKSPVGKHVHVRAPSISPSDPAYDWWIRPGVFAVFAAVLGASIAFNLVSLTAAWCFDCKRKPSRPVNYDKVDIEALE